MPAGLMPVAALVALLGPIERPLQWQAPGRYVGARLAGVTITDFARSEVAAGQQLVTLQLAGRTRWRTRCLQTVAGPRVTLACALRPDGHPAQFISLTARGEDPWQGFRVAAGVFPVEGQPPARTPDRHTGSLRWRGATPDALAVWSAARAPRLTLSPPVATGHAAEALAVATLAVETAGDLRPEPGVTGGARPVFYDGLPLRLAAVQPADPAPADALAAVSAEHAEVLRDLLTRGQSLRLDRAAGTRVQRLGDAGRLVIELSAGALTAPGPGGAAPSGIDGVSIDVAGGVRLARRTALSVSLGVQVGTVDRAELQALPGVQSADSAGFALGLHLRHTLDLGWGIEPVLGVRARGRARFVEVDERLPSDQARPSPERSLQGGLGLAPTIGLQWPWTLNAHDTRVVVFLEAAPEWTVWTAPHLSGGEFQPGQVGVRAPRPGLDEVLDTQDTQITTQLGVRFEL